jgi:uncharacterized protein YjaG (DUF416 family)
MEKIKNKISGLSYHKQFLFAFSCVERIISFLKDYELDNNIALIDKIENILSENISLANFYNIKTFISDENIEELENLIPDTDDDGSDEAVLAQNAAICLVYCVDFIKNNNVEFILYCSQKVIETIDVIALGIMDLDNSNELINKEIDIQNEFIAKIGSFSNDFNCTEQNDYEFMINLYKVKF